MKPSYFDAAIDLSARELPLNMFVQDTKHIIPYAHHYWRRMCSSATHLRAALLDGRFAGALLAEVNGAKAPYASRKNSLLIKLYEQKLFLVLDPSINSYVDANRAMREKYDSTHRSEAELSFLAVEPWARRTGLGSALLADFERAHPGLEYRLFTDSACSWQFYESQGFERVCERRIVLRGKTELTCMLYRKRSGSAH